MKGDPRFAEWPTEHRAANQKTDAELLYDFIEAAPKTGLKTMIDPVLLGEISLKASLAGRSLEMFEEFTDAIEDLT